MQQAQKPGFWKKPGFWAPARGSVVGTGHKTDGALALCTEFWAKDPKLREALEREPDAAGFLAREPFYQRRSLGGVERIEKAVPGLAAWAFECRPFRPRDRFGAMAGRKLPFVSPGDSAILGTTTESAARRRAARQVVIGCGVPGFCSPCAT